MIVDWQDAPHVVDDLEEVPTVRSLKRVTDLDHESGKYGLLVISKQIDYSTFGEQTDLIKCP